ncbi:MAG: L,D-transpeptidase [Candidatus Glassbacteria bacterium]
MALKSLRHTLAFLLYPIVPLSALSCVSSLERSLKEVNVPDGVDQVVLVTTDGWEADSGTMRLFERVEGGWRESGTCMDVVVGRNGMGWGCGIPWDAKEGPLKTEGDGRSPAGAFEFQTAFGYDSLPPEGTRMPYRSITKDDYFVDDPLSEDYNRWVRLESGKDPSARWRSFERMLRPDGLYSLGIVIKHNSDPVVKGKGSAIFIHIWKSAKMPTAGCTALSRPDLLRLLGWLDPQKSPLLLQLPIHEIKDFRIRPPFD